MKFIVLISSLALTATSFTVPTAFSPRVSSPTATTGLTRTTKLFAEEYGASSTSFYTTTEKQVERFRTTVVAPAVVARLSEAQAHTHTYYYS